ncbi:M14 family metallopeptidase [Kiloniella laminariae]|uniref:M14 family metallopeptidase n=1 Tax=Kiloniella laminariae TaxID=454162 RepID=UPI00037ABE1C|nr:M14-type cytosolic carboxypeptidase [Kiloniella laminariae]
MIRISSNFDAGNIRCLACDTSTDIQLEIEADSNSHFYQWFYFRLTGAQDQSCHLKILNAGGAAYPAGWEGYQAVASYDRETWFRVPNTSFDGQILNIEITPAYNSIYFAYFAPYSMERHADLIADAQHSSLASLEILGKTIDGQDIDLLTVGESDGDKKACWIIARQHPGESMTEYWMEGFLDRLLDENDPVARELLKKAVFYIVPNMNPDGSRRGNLRVNASGANLNREWQAPSPEKSPEVYYVRKRMMETGVDFLFDIHGDEAIPHNFIAGTHGIPSFDDRLLNLLDRFKAYYREANPDFQTTHGYPQNAPGQGNLTMCGNNTAETHDCLSMTLEMPFKDTADNPDEFEGWSPDRSIKLGASSLDPLYRLIDDLR